MKGEKKGVWRGSSYTMMNTFSLTITDISCQQCLPEIDIVMTENDTLSFQLFIPSMVWGLCVLIFCAPPLSPFAFCLVCVWLIGVLNLFPSCLTRKHTCGSLPRNQPPHKRLVHTPLRCQMTLARLCVLYCFLDCRFLVWSPVNEYLEFHLPYFQPQPTRKLGFCLCLLACLFFFGH